MKKFEDLQLITQPINGDKSSFDICKEYLLAGGRWIQLRLKDTPDDVIFEEAIKLRDLCNTFSAQFIINDNPHIAIKCNADGVHLGKNDISPSEARKILGDKFIIGGTANTFADVQNLHSQKVDYIGLGPYRFTETKKNLSPVLGINGYREIKNKMLEANIDIPVVAIGGIEFNDISEILGTGINGIAVSSLIIKNGHPGELTKKILTELYKYETIKNC